MSEDASRVEYGPILYVRFVVVVTKVEIATCPAVGSGCIEISGVAVYFYSHVAGVESDNGVGVCGAVIHQLMDGLLCFLDAPNLL